MLCLQTRSCLGDLGTYFTTFAILPPMSRNIGIVSIWELGEGAFAGTEHFIHNLGIAIEKAGDHVTCISPAKTNTYQGLSHKTIKLEGISNIDEHVLRKYVNDIGARSTIKLFSKSLELFDINNPGIDAYIINSPFFAYFSSDKNHAFVLHDNPDEFDNYLGKAEAKEFIEAFSEGMKARVITPSKHYQKIYGDLLGRNIDVIEHALNPKYLGRKTEKGTLANSTEIKIIVPSRLEPVQKGQDIVLNAIALLEKPLRNKISLIMTGLDTPYLENKKILLKKSTELGINATIDNYDDLLAIITDSDIVVLPSRFESFGYSAQECIALGKRVILSDIPTYKEIGSGTLNVSYFQSDSANDLARVLIKTIESGEEATPDSKWFSRYDYEIWGKRYLENL